MFSLRSVGSLVALMLCILFGSAQAEAQEFAWANQIGGTGSETSQDVVLDATGNVYTVGTFQGTADFNPGSGVFNLTSAGGHDVFVSKLDANGNFMWAKRFGDVNDDRPFGVALDNSANIHIAGLFRGVVDFDPGSGT